MIENRIINKFGNEADDSSTRTVFSSPIPWKENGANLVVFRNGQLIIKDSDYSVVDDNTIQLSSSVSTSDQIAMQITNIISEQSDLIALDRVSKKIEGKTQTSFDKSVYEESIQSHFIMHADEIWATDIPSNVNDAISIAVAYEYDTLTLTEDVTVANKKGWYSTSNGQISGRITNWIPPKFGQAYTIRLYDALDNEIPSSDAMEWKWDYQAGYLFIEYDNDYQKPFKIKGYIYTGSFVSDTQSSGGTSFWKSPVPTESALPTSGNIDGEIRLTLDTNSLYVWEQTESKWVSTSYGSKKFRDPVVSFSDLPLQDSFDGDIRLVLDENALYRFNASLNQWEDVVGNHTHDNRYYTQTQIDDLLEDKSDFDHNHDSRYYTKVEIEDKVRWRPSVESEANLPPYTENNDGDVILTRDTNEIWRWDSSIAPQGKWVSVVAAGLSWKPPVQTVGDLPTLDNVVGDVRLVIEEGLAHWWDGTAWFVMGIGDHNHDDSYYTKDEIHDLVRWKSPVTDKLTLPTIDNENGDVRLTLDDSSVYRWNGSDWVLISASPRWRDPVDDVTDLPAVGNVDGDTRIVKGNRLIYQWDGTEWIIISNPPHTHEGLYYTQEELDEGRLDDRYFTEAEILEFFNINTGHDHDGVNSKKINYNNLVNVPYFYWKNPVQLYADLPTAGNTPGDVRLVLDNASAYAWSGVGWNLINSGSFALNGHNHDDRYYTESEIDDVINDVITNLTTQLAQKADINHEHNDLYYRKFEVEDLIDERFNVNTGHDHDGIDSKKISYWSLTDIPPLNAHDHDDRYYTRLRLQTSGDAQVHWDNIFAKPDLANEHWRSPVQTVGDLPPTGNDLYDIRLVLDDSDIYEWNGNEWVFIGHWANQYVNYWKEPVENYTDLPFTLNVHGDVRLVIGENTLYRWDSNYQQWIGISSFMQNTSVQVYLNGVLMSDGLEYIRTKDRAIRYLEPSNLVGGDRITFIITGDYYLRQDFVVYPGQEVFEILNKFHRQDIVVSGPLTHFTVTEPYALGTNELLVWVNGLLQWPGIHYEELTSTMIRFINPLEAGDRLVLIVTGRSTGNGEYIREDHQAYQDQQFFNLNNFYKVSTKKLLVYLNGQLLKVNDDYEEISNSTVKLLFDCTTADQVTFLIFEVDDVGEPSGGGGCCNGEDIILGVPEDGTYYDGLLQLFPEMKINNAVDDINEALLQLAPEKPLSISNRPLESDLQFVSGFVSDGNVNYEFIPGRHHVYLTNNNTFTVYTPNDIGFADADKGRLDLYINNNRVDTFNLYDAFVENNRNSAQTATSYGILAQGARANVGQAGTNGAIRNSENNLLSVMNVEKYNNFSLWQKGKVRININQTVIRRGYNTIRVVHVINEQERQTQDFKFFYDDSGTHPTISQQVYLENTEMVSNKYVSGVRYFSIGDTFRLTFTAFGIFDNTYIQVPITLDMPGLQPHEIEYDDPNASGFSDPPGISQFFDYQGDLSLNEFNEYSVDATMMIKTYDPFSPGEEKETTHVNRLINTYTNGSTDLIEHFRDEQFRLPEDTYDVVPIQRSNQWNSVRHLTEGEALIFDNHLRYANYDFRLNYRPAQTANYSSFTDPQRYYRAFYKQVARNNGSFIINGLTANQLLTNKILIDIKLPTQTGWLSLNAYYDEVTFSGIDGDGCLLNIEGNVFSYSTGLLSTANSGYTIIVRITLPNSTAPTIEYMELQL